MSSGKIPREKCQECQRTMKCKAAINLEGKRVCRTCYKRQVTIMPSVPGLFKEPINKSRVIYLCLTETQNRLLGERLKYLFPLNQQSLGTYARALILGDLKHWKKTSYSQKVKISFNKTNGSPEQYNILQDGELIAHSKLLYGNLMVNTTDSERIIFDEYVGLNTNEFKDKESRNVWLNKVAKEILNLQSDLGVSEIPVEGDR